MKQEIFDLIEVGNEMYDYISDDLEIVVAPDLTRRGMDLQTRWREVRDNLQLVLEEEGVA